MTRRGQVTVGLLAGILPALVLAAVAVMFVGVRANAERAQRFADAAALQAAVMRGSESQELVAQQIGLGEDSTLTLSEREAVVTAHVQLPRLTFWIPLARQTVVIAPEAWSSARGVTLADGEAGAVRVD
ncbi:MAG: hypothetical protein CK540_05210 [Thermoleophilia bacterium]|nr:MAG: hypothetical protein CK540_05210 [Thermoleophilia bacterium]